MSSCSTELLLRRMIRRVTQRWYAVSAASVSRRWRAAKHKTAWNRIGHNRNESSTLNVKTREALVQSSQRPRCTAKWWKSTASSCPTARSSVEWQVFFEKLPCLWCGTSAELFSLRIRPDDSDDWCISGDSMLEVEKAVVEWVPDRVWAWLYQRRWHLLCTKMKNHNVNRHSSTAIMGRVAFDDRQVELSDVQAGNGLPAQPIMFAHAPPASWFRW